MKKIISLLIVFTLIISSITAFATAEDDFYAALFDNLVYSGNIKMEMSVNANSKLFDLLEDEGFNIDIVNQSKITMDAKVDVAKDYQTMKMYINMALITPDIAGYEAIADSMKAEFWYDIDFANNKMLFITKMNGSQYMYVDYLSESYPENMPNMSEMMKPEQLMDLQKQLFVSIDRDKIKPVYKDGIYTVTLDAEGVKSILKDYFAAMEPIFTNYFTAIPEELAGGDLKQQFDDVLAKLDGLKLFAEDAFVMECTLNEKKELIDQKIKINFETNVYDIIKAFGGDVPEITKENSDLALTLNVSAVTENANEKIDIEIPELTAENSVDMLEFAGNPVVADDPNEIRVLVDFGIVNFDVKPVMEDDRVLVPVRKFLNSIGVSDEDIAYDEEFGIVTIKYNNDIVELSIGNKTAYINDTPVELDVPAKEIDGRTLLPLRFVGETFGYGVEWSQNGDFNGGTVFLNKK